MRIAIVLGAFLPVPPVMGGAVEKVWFTLTQEFARRGHAVTLISRRFGKFPREEVVDNVRHLRVPGFDTPRSLVWLKLLDLIYSRRVLAILSPADVVVTNTFWLPILLGGKKRGAIYVHVARFPKWQMRLYRTTARLQAPSRAVARAIEMKAPELAPKIIVIPYPAPKPLLPDSPPPISSRGKVILFVGRVHPEKGVHLLVGSFASKARTVFADWKLMIVGPAESRLGGGGGAYLESLRRLANSASDRVVFAGAVFDPALLEETLRAARLFVYPSLAEQGESFGLAPLEAMAHGCAVLVSNLDCFHDFIRDGETGFIFDHRSHPQQSLEGRMEHVITDSTLLARVAEAGLRKSTEYSVARIADQFLNDFESLVRKSDAGTS